MAFSGVVEGDKYRYYLDGEGEKNTKWKYGAPPNYDVVNKLFEQGRTKVHLDLSQFLSISLNLYTHRHAHRYILSVKFVLNGINY